jgi:hypothetical protein
MSDKPMNKSRRDAVKTVLGGLAAVPVMNLVASAAAYAQADPASLPAVTMDDPTADALKYNPVAADADRAGAARPGLAPEEQFCHNCQFQVGAAGDGYLQCSLFTGKKVTVDGWCSSWTLKAG